VRVLLSPGDNRSVSVASSGGAPGRGEYAVSVDELFT
jgi:hypothetical protein